MQARRRVDTDGFKNSEQVSKFEEESDRNSLESLSIKAKASRIASEKPAIVALFDDQGKDGLLDHIKVSLEEMYPPLWAQSTTSGNIVNDDNNNNSTKNESESGNPFDTGQADTEKAKESMSSQGSPELSKHNACAKAVLSYFSDLFKKCQKDKGSTSSI